MSQRKKFNHSESPPPTPKGSTTLLLPSQLDADELQIALRYSVAGLGFKRAISEAAIFEGFFVDKCLLCVAHACGTSSGYPFRCVLSSESDDTLHTQRRLRPLLTMKNRTIRSVYDPWSSIYFGRSVRILPRKYSKRRT